MPPPLPNPNDLMQLKLQLEQRLKLVEDRLNGLLRPDGCIELSSPRRIELIVGSSRVLLEPSGVTVRSAATVKVDAPRVELIGAQVQVKGSNLDLDATVVNINAPMAKAEGVMQCNTLQAVNVVGTNYTPGAGNIW